jgi:signal transduction histidine kinase
VLADAADVLSDQLRQKLGELASLLHPRARQLEQQFRDALEQEKAYLAVLDDRQAAALRAITPGAALWTLGENSPISEFFEQVEYNGRRLAKMHLPPSTIIAALEQYDRVLARLLESLMPRQKENLRWVREQLMFCVILTLNNAFYQVREGETRAFYELFRVELESRSLEELLERFLLALTEVTGAARARLYLLNEDATVWTLGASVGRSVRTPRRMAPSNAGLRTALSEARCYLGAGASHCGPDPEWSAKGKTLWSVPLTGGGEACGVLQFSFDKDFEWLPREKELLAAAAERCWMAIEKQRLVEGLAAREEQVRQLAEHMLHVEEAERRRISRELHDEAGQSMLCIRLQMEMVENSLPESMAEHKRRLGEVRMTTERTILEIRRLIAALSPAVLDQLGLGAALRQLVNRFHQVNTAKVRLSLHGLGSLPKKTEIIVYRLVQECFNNIAKHSRASSVNLSVSCVDRSLRLNVEDNGIGFDVEAAFARRESFGLSGMRERVALLGGTFQIESNPGAAPEQRQGARGRGTRILIELPLPGEAEQTLQKASKARAGTGRNKSATKRAVGPGRKVNKTLQAQ